jgi:SAF domain
VAEIARTERPSILLLDPRDTVAVALVPLQPGASVEIPRDRGTVRLTAETLIPFGHKIAVAPMDVGGPVVKYGEVIGVATCPIRPGQHVHVHNVRSDRAGAGNG